MTPATSLERRRGAGGPRAPLTRPPARRTHLMPRARPGGAAAEPEAEAEAERGAQQHRGGQQRGRRPHGVPAQRQPRVALAGRRAAGHRGRSGGGSAALFPPPRATLARRQEHRPRQLGNSGLAALAGRGAARSADFSGLRALLPLAPVPLPGAAPPEGGAWVFRPKLRAAPAPACPCTEHAWREARCSAKGPFGGAPGPLSFPGRNGGSLGHGGGCPRLSLLSVYDVLSI